MMPRRGTGLSQMMRSMAFARTKAATASILGPWSRRSWSSGGSGQRMLSPPGGISKSRGVTISSRSGSTATEAELSTASATALKPIQQPVVEVLLDRRGVEHRYHRGDEVLLALVRERRGLAAVVVAGDRQHTAVRRRAGGVRVLERVDRAVDSGSLAVPDAEHAI